MITHSSELEKASLQDLDRLFTHDEPFSIPESGIFEAKYLQKIDSRVSAKLYFRLMTIVLFEWTPFGISFSESQGTWYFFKPHIKMG
ncbi:hypothetical protein ACFL27_10480, partial [candidate division CSSED10-310 bacterium]